MGSLLSRAVHNHAAHLFFSVLLCRLIVFQWHRAVVLVKFWRAAELYRYSTHPSLETKLEATMAVCSRFFGISMDVSRSRHGGSLAEMQTLIPGDDHGDAIHLRSLLDLYEPGIVVNIVARINKWRAEKQSGALPSDLLLSAQHVVERALAETSAAEFVNEFW